MLPVAQPRLFRSLACVAGLLVMLLGLLVLRVRPLLLDAPEGRVVAGSLALLGAGAAVVLAALSRRWRHSPAAVAGAGVVIVLVLQFAVHATRGVEPVKAMAQHVLEQRAEGERVAPYGIFVRNLLFYTHVEQENLFNHQRLVDYLSRPDRVLCVMRDSDLEALRAGPFPNLRRLAAITYFDAATAKPRTLLWPDPARDRVTAVLVDNGH
jgi:hypothetical protein